MIVRKKSELSQKSKTFACNRVYSPEIDRLEHEPLEWL
jgi:hypothetical protein